VDWIGLAQDRDNLSDLVNAVMSLRVAQTAAKLSSGQTTRGTSIGCWWESQREGDH
jgi:hypothetical protein